MKNPIICVDFDGVIHSYTSGWKGVDIIPDPPVAGAIEFLEEHLPLPDCLGISGPFTGPIVQIYSSRSKSWFGRRAMKNWLIKHGMHRAYIDDGILQFPDKKPVAFLTIDDRAICFMGMWPTTEQMLSFKPWHKYKLGTTNAFPDGKCSNDDEGELRLAVVHDRDNVHIKFGKPVAWLALPKNEAMAFSKMIMAHAEKL